MANKMKQDMAKETVTPVKVQSYLNGLDYPAMRDQIIDHADSMDAPEDVLGVLRNIPEKEYRTPADVTKEIGRM